MRTTAAAEWAWVAGRFGLVLAAIIGTSVFLSGTSAFSLLISLSVIVLAADAGIGWLLYRDSVRQAFIAGLALDTLTILIGWTLGTWLLAGTEHTNDVYLILFPVLVSGAVRLGWPLGVAQALLFILWVAGINVLLLGSSTYAVEQTPLRILFMVATVGLTAWLVGLLRREREYAEEKWKESETLAGLGRIISSSPDIDSVYRRFSEAVAELLPFDRMSISTVSGGDGAITLRYVEGQQLRMQGPSASNLLEISLTGYVLQSLTPIRVGVGKKIEHPSPTPLIDSSGQAFRSSLCAPVISVGMAIGALTLHTFEAGAYDEADEENLLRIADQISGALATELSHTREMGLIEAHGELEAENRELERVNEEKSKFLSTVSHELKTPLTSMLAFADILKRNKKGNLDDKDLDQLTVIQRNGRRLSILIDDLVDVARFDAGSLQISPNEFDAVEMLDDVVKSFGPIFEGKDQQLRLIAPYESIRIFADQARLAQVITNLISNASKYSPHESVVEIEVSVVEDRLGIAVRDNGNGISEEDQAKLFIPFFRVESDVESAVPGTGLGLAISNSIVELHDGDLTVDSEPGKGSVFWVSIPGIIEGQSGISVPEGQPETEFASRLAHAADEAA
ncbi:MAG: GAF domain-containing protein [Chloroflexi bacterium]|nr:GAF domain-containing protein [Chloroflexota bacterium]